jgi:acyl dehydratase
MAGTVRDRSIDERIDAFIEASRALNGEEVTERPVWNSAASADAIRHFAHGIGDDNPLWLNPDYAAGTRHGQPLAPPTFLASVLYPVLHGAPLEAPLASLVGEIEFRWQRPVSQGTSLQATTRQTDVHESKDRRGQRLICIVSEATYRDGDGAVVGSARGTLMRIALQGPRLLLDRIVSRLPPDESGRVRALQLENRRRGGRSWFPVDLCPPS